jgi:hypothetical protein
MGYRKMAKDEAGNRYVQERGFVDGDAVLKVIDFQTATRPDGVVYWPTANYEVSVPSADPPVEGVRIVRTGNGLYTVPDKARGVPLLNAVKIALGRMQAPALNHAASFRGRPPVPDPHATRIGRDAGSTEPRADVGRNAPQVIEEPAENRELQRGERILKHLALYPDGVDVQTMAAGMFALTSGAIRSHLTRLVKNNGPVASPAKGIYVRREQS